MPEAGADKDPAGTGEAVRSASAAAPAPEEGAGPPARVAGAGPPVPGPGRPPEDAVPEQRGHWFYYGLGLSLQTLLWFLLFLAITVAVLVGNKLTEFRYVGF